ncbi:PepSY domain-containing protein [Rhodococcus rhodnii]|uniref:PepSY domain-containing protein n=1 Tax=Rhodococcus rhodnii TaxID=38312 RepID=A0A6P2CHP5_9NOCA|nr:PepSY domain-containing protein [Rhodococcus rhodnii]TXG92289.1 PepSY domain-containing protein [Rhodococcus rhodnii]
MPDAGASPPPGPPTPPRTARPFFLRLHFYAGILIAPFLLIATISGGLYAVAPTLEQIVYRDYLQVDTPGDPRPVSEQIAAAAAERPDLTVSAVQPAAEPGDTTRVLFDDPSLGDSERLSVFVDPATAQPIGELTVYGSSGALPLRTWISELHRHLHLGEPGRIYSELAASWLWLVALGGLYLWFDRRRRSPKKTSILAVDRTTKGRNRTVEWHGVVGLWIATGLLFLSATGLMWSAYAGANVAEVRSALSWQTPTVATALGGAGSAADEHAGHGSHGGAATSTGTPRVDEVDTALASARGAGVDGPVEVSIPSDDATAFTVAEIRRPWVMSNDSVAVDGATGQITDASWFADWPLPAKLTAWGIQLHMGMLFGIVNQLVLLALAVALATVIVRGYVLWWRRRPTRGDRIVGRAPARGAVRRLHPAAVVGLVIGAIAIGWFVPLLGISLVVFLVVDAAVGLYRRRTAGGTHVS